MRITKVIVEAMRKRIELKLSGNGFYIAVPDYEAEKWWLRCCDSRLDRCFDSLEDCERYYKQLTGGRKEVALIVIDA